MGDAPRINPNCRQGNIRTLDTDSGRIADPKWPVRWPCASINLDKSSRGGFGRFAAINPQIQVSCVPSTLSGQSVRLPNSAQGFGILRHLPPKYGATGGGQALRYRNMPNHTLQCRGCRKAYRLHRG